MRKLTLNKRLYIKESIIIVYYLKQLWDVYYNTANANIDLMNYCATIIPLIRKGKGGGK